MDEMKKKQQKQMITIFVAVFYVFTVFVALHIATARVIDYNPNFLEQILAGLQHLEKEPLEIVLSVHSFTYAGLMTLIFIFAVVWIHNDSLINGPGEANPMGSAKWNTDLKAYNKRYSDPPKSVANDGEKNMILTQDIFLNMDSRQTRRNNNILVVGGSGAETTGKFLEGEGYEVKVFNLVEMNKSDRYNPFAYIRDDVGVLMMINCLIKNTTPVGQSGGDPFWEKSETALLQALQRKFLFLHQLLSVCFDSTVRKSKILL